MTIEQFEHILDYLIGVMLAHPRAVLDALEQQCEALRGQILSDLRFRCPACGRVMETTTIQNYQIFCPHCHQSIGVTGERGPSGDGVRFGPGEAISHPGAREK
jgi:hypothetical protein